MSGSGVRSGQPPFPGAATATRALGLLGLAGALGGIGWQLRRLAQGLRRGRRLAAAARPYERLPVDAPGVAVNPPRRLLLLGDSTGVGVGADRPEQSLAGLLGEAFPGVAVLNRCESGARTADIARQAAPLAAAGERFDLVIVLAGGNDVIRHTPLGRLARDARDALTAAAQVASGAAGVVWAGSANVGGSPLLARPLAWWLERRTLAAMARLGQEARAAGALFVDFCRPRADCVFARHAGLCFAGDGVHPSAASYRLCFQALLHEARLADRLGAPTPHPTEPPEIPPWPRLPKS